MSETERRVYTITTVNTLTGIGGMRAVGYAHEYAEAAEWVTNNSCDINEDGSYRYVVIESVPPGIYMVPRPEYWFEWSKYEQEYIPCEKPKRFKQVVGFSMG